jgi:hypothetical protein
VLIQGITMTSPRILAVAATGIAAAALAFPAAASAGPIDYATLPVDPNVITDSVAYLAGAPVQDPDGKPGVEVVYTHRDGTRAITDMVLVLPDPQAATVALDVSRGDVLADIPGASSRPIAIGQGGTLITGRATNGQDASVLLFTQGPAVAAVRFNGAAGDPVPLDLVTDYGKQQNANILAALST